MGYSEISFLEFGEILKPLVGRWKRQAADQIDAYYSMLKNANKDHLDKACKHLAKRAVHFPSPGEIEDSMREIANKEYRENKSPFQELPSCHRCQHGYVQFWYEHTCRNGKTIKRVDVRPCGFCNTEPNASQHHIQVDNQIYKAARLLPGTKHMWVPDTNNREIRMDILEPVYAQKDLEIYCEQERSGKVVRSEPPKELLEKLRGITGKTPSLSFDPEEAL